MMMNREQAEARIAELRAAVEAAVRQFNNTKQAYGQAWKEGGELKERYYDRIQPEADAYRAALTALQRAERAYGAWLQPVGHFAHDERCSWCNESYRRKQQAEAELTEALR